MFAPKIAKAQMKAAADSNSLARPRSTLTGNVPRGHVEQKADLMSLTAREAPPRVSWDFSQIPVFAPDRPNRPQWISPFITPSLPAAMQPKLTVGEVNDPLEHEADRVADQVLRIPDPDLYVASAPLQLRRKCATCEEEDKASMLQAQPTRSAELAASEAPPVVREVLSAPGTSLDQSTRAFFEPRFGYDFSRVNVHANREAASAARAVQARAYTVGRDIVFGSGEYVPGTAEGKRLLAHELTHVIQQRSASVDGIVDDAQIDEEGEVIAVDGRALGIVPSVVSGPVLQRQDQSVMPRIRVVTNHQFPLTAANVSNGLMSGNGGVSEMEVSNGSDVFNGQTVSEVFVGQGGDNPQVGGCNNAQGQGGQSGSTFTIGTGASFSRFGININLPAKDNTFYDMHIKAFGTNVLPAGVNSQSSLCMQQYTWGLATLNNGQVFNRVHNITRTNISGTDVANIDLVK